MKKSSFFRIIIIVCLALCVAISTFACNDSGDEEITATSLKVLTSHDGAYVLGENVDLSEVTMLLTYSDDSTKTITLNDTMVSDSDVEKFFTLGAHTVSINYKGLVCSLQIEVVAPTETKNYLVQFYSLGGTDVPSLTANVINAFTIPQRVGYTFDGWYVDMSYNGDKAIEPYVLTKDTAFYAKWIDNRICTVRFEDEDGSIIYTEEIHYGEKIDVNAFSYPYEKLGKTFIGWNVTNGDADNVMVDLIVKASFITDKCTVLISYLNTSGTVVDVERTFDYGEKIDVAEYVLPTKEGHTSRWVVYYDHAEDEDVENFSELPEDKKVTLVSEYTTIRAYYTINTYDIIIHNGKVAQTETALKNGTIELERIYQNASASRNFSVDWNTGFDFSEHTQEPDVSQPAKLYDSNGINGYTSQWCFVITLDGGEEVWYNTSGQIWDEGTQSFIDPPTRPNNEGANNWTLLDKDGNYVARVKNKILTEIKGDVTVKAKYVKRQYTVTLYRKASNGPQVRLVTFAIKYYTEFNPYENYFYNPSPVSNVTSYEIINADYANKAQLPQYNLESDDKTNLEQFYMIENTNSEIKRYASGYYITGETNEDYLLDDWNIDWYTNAGANEESRIDFIEDNSVVVKSDTQLYCVDTDNRLYEIYFFYDYSFETGTYNSVDSLLVKENEGVTEPNGGKISSISTNFNGVDLVYSFRDWYETSYDVYLKTGYRGAQLNVTASRKEAMYYYAHYDCSKTFNIKIYDNTQSTAYIGKSGITEEGFDYSQYSVQADTIFYTVPAGSVFSMDMIYKGYKNADGSIVSGSTFYDKYIGNDFYEKAYVSDTGLYNYLVDTFTDRETLSYVKDVLNAYLTIYKNVKNSVYAHNYVYTDAEYDYMLNNKFTTTVTMDNFADAVDGYGDDFATVYNALISAGYDSSKMQKLGNFEDFITYYKNTIKDFYDSGYTTALTGFTGLTHLIDTSFETSSDYENIAMTIYVINEYIAFWDKKLENQTKFENPTMSPKYNTSEKYLNLAYEYDIEQGEQKYSFSGWYTDVAYSKPYYPSFYFESFYASDNISLYAKWTDVTKGTEGLVYEEVLLNDGTNAYVLVDFTTANEFEIAGYGNDYHYVTRNDNFDIPQEIGVDGKIDIQIPSSIDKYIKVTVPQSDIDDWNNKFKDYLVKESNTYIQSSGSYDATKDYYIKESYPVIGIKDNAFSKHNTVVKSVTIPLNLYFIEEGAFANCYVQEFSRTGAKIGETPLNHVILDGSSAIYQWDACPFTSIVGKESGIEYALTVQEKTVNAFAKDSSLTTYTLIENTQRIGAYSFYYATKITSVQGVNAITSIGNNAFNGATNLSTIGATANKITIPKTVTKIEESAFNGCTKFADLEIEANSALDFVGYKAFYNSGWYNSNNYGVISLVYNTLGETISMIIGVGNAGETHFDKEGTQNVKYNENGIVDASGEYNGATKNGNIVLYKNGKLTKIIINNKVTFINDEAFKGCVASEIVFADASALYYIGNSAFASTSQLDNITFIGEIPANQLTLGTNVFYGRSEDAKLTLNFDTKIIADNVTQGETWEQYLSVLNVQPKV